MPSELRVMKTIEWIQGIGKAVMWVVEAEECCAGPVSSWPGLGQGRKTIENVCAVEIVVPSSIEILSSL